MSKQALFYYAENLHLVQKATFTTPAGKEYGLGENGRDLLIFLCNGANEKRDYCFHMGYSYIAEETDIHISTVKRLMAGFEQLGWITRTGEVVRHMGRGAPTVEYELTFFTSSLAQNMRTGRPTSRPGATESLGKAKPVKEAPHYFDTETEPEPDTEPEPEPGEPKSEDLEPLRQRKEGINKAEVMRLVIEKETAEMVRNRRPVTSGLIKRWESDYPTFIAQGITQGINELEALVKWCLDAKAIERTGKAFTHTQDKQQTTHLPAPSKGMANCFVCEGVGHGLVRDSQGVATTRKCVCAGGTWNGETTLAPTPERVSADLSSNTHIPTPPGSADPQSFTQLVKDISQNFTHK